MKTVILCGGFGTRIRDVADNIPKPMIPVGGKPIIWHIMKYYAHFNHKEFVLCTGYKSEEIKNFFINYDLFTRDITLQYGSEIQKDFHGESDINDWKITLAETGLNAMTGARVRKIQKYIGDDDTFFLTYGDGLSDVDIEGLLKFHKSHGKVLTVTGVRPGARFGVIEANNEGQVESFVEKPQSGNGLINGGFFVCSKEIFKYLDGDDKLTFESEPMHRLVNDKQLMVFEHEGFWQPMDTFREYKLLNDLIESEKAPWKVW